MLYFQPYKVIKNQNKYLHGFEVLSLQQRPWLPSLNEQVGPLPTRCWAAQAEEGRQVPPELQEPEIEC